MGGDRLRVPADRVAPERFQAGRRSENQHVPSVGQSGVVMAPGSVLSLQRQVGNRAVTYALAGRPVVQRFVGSEHKQLGDTTATGPMIDRMIDLGNGVVLSWGDIVALAGDEYASLDDLLADTRNDAGKQRLLAAFRDDHIPDPSRTRLPEPTEKQEADRFVAFLALAAENVEHFNAGGQAVERWQSDHTAAIAAAVDAGLAGNAAGRELALAREAFGQHFLTDAFSGGHIRTPRPDIIGWYRASFGPPVVDEFIRRMSARLIDGLVAQISPQTRWPDFIVRREVSKAVGEKLATAIAKLDGGRAKLNDYFALAVAGVVSGAMHDLEGRRGVTVVSEAHPQPWIAFGDAKLSGSPDSRAQAELAIAGAVAHIDAAYEIGRRHGHGADPAHAPRVVYFGFDSAELSPGAAGELAAASSYLHARPEAQVTVTGHTDPTGPDAYNEMLGLQRAQAVALRLTAAGVTPDQIVTLSQGERSLVTTAPGQFRLNRRVTFDYVSRSGPYRDVGRDEAMAESRSTIGPPYPDITRFVPHPVEDPITSPAVGQSTVATAQVELEDWRWGHIPANLRGEINTWVRGYGPAVIDKIAKAKELDDDTVEGYSIQPRPLVQAIVTDLLRDPAKFMESAFGSPMSP